jgi:hypothetical protein
LPEDFDLAGAVMNESEGIVAWSRSTPRLLLAGEGRMAIVEYPSIYGALATRFVDSNRLIEVLDPSNGRLVRMDTTGAISGESFLGPFTDSLVLVAATPIGASWGVAGRDRHGNIHLYIKEPGHPATHVGTLRRSDYAQTLPDSGAPLNVYLRGTTSSGRLLATLQWFPFQVSLFPVDHARLLNFAPGLLSVLPNVARSIDSLNHRALISLPAVSLDQGYLQTIADLKSDSRVLVRYDERGKVVAQVHLAIPLGILQSLPTKRELLAVRTSGGSELVLYEWHWSRQVTPLRGSNQ